MESVGRDYSLVGQARRLETLAAIHRLRSELDAMEASLLAAMATDPDPYRGEPVDSGKQWVREDVACVLRIPSVTAQHKLAVCTDVATRFPATLAAMRAGQLRSRYAERLVEATAGLSDDAAHEVEDRVLQRAGSQTLAQFGRAVGRAVVAVDTRAAEVRHAAARDQRRVVFTPVDDGMTELWALLPAEQAATLRATVERAADSWRGLDDRTADQRRADALCTLVGATNPAVPNTGAKTAVNVTVALSTLLGLDDQPGDLDGHGPIPASLARSIAFGADSTWRRLLIDDAGRLIDVSSRAYRPPAPMSRFVQLRDRTCQFPTCNRKANRCEIDHVRPYGHGGATRPDNLFCLCARHHHLKHEGGWQLRREPDGAAAWTSPTGLTFTRPPPEPAPV